MINLRRLEVTVTAVLPHFPRDSRSLVMDQPEIASSLDLTVEEKTIGTGRQKRAVVIVSVPSTVTSYEFSATPVIKSYTLLSVVNNPANLLVCLPAGYTVC